MPTVDQDEERLTTRASLVKTFSILIDENVTQA